MAKIRTLQSINPRPITLLDLINISDPGSFIEVIVPETDFTGEQNFVITACSDNQIVLYNDEEKYLSYLIDHYENFRIYEVEITVYLKPYLTAEAYIKLTEQFNYKYKVIDEQ